MLEADGNRSRSVVRSTVARASSRPVVRIVHLLTWKSKSAPIFAVLVVVLCLEILPASVPRWADELQNPETSAVCRRGASYFVWESAAASVEG